MTTKQRIQAARAALRDLRFLGYALSFCEVRNVTLDEVLGESRWPQIVDVRHELWALVHGTFVLSFAETARIFGVDHTTVIAAVRTRECRIGGRPYRKCDPERTPYERRKAVA